jgi:protein involved in ribonucleotide reduction
MIQLVYFSSASENTHRFVAKLGLPAQRIPLRPADPPLEVTEPYVLVVPTYGGGNLGGAVPKQVIRFLNDPGNRSLIRGVISAGNTNFGEAYCIAGEIVAAKCHVPHLYQFELMGTPDDVEAVREGLQQLCQRLSSAIPAWSGSANRSSTTTRSTPC